MEWLPATGSDHKTGKTDNLSSKLTDDPGQVRNHFALGLACIVGLLNGAGYPRSDEDYERADQITSSVHVITHIGDDIAISLKKLPRR